MPGFFPGTASTGRLPGQADPGLECGVERALPFEVPFHDIMGNRPLAVLFYQHVIPLPVLLVEGRVHRGTAVNLIKTCPEDLCPGELHAGTCG